jgi:hypothetical protein
MMAGARFNSSNFIEMHPIQGARASACFGVVHVNSVKGRWDQKWNRRVERGSQQGAGVAGN